jgi:ribosomal protein S18 acetylase RimI-like enzyme
MHLERLTSGDWQRLRKLRLRALVDAPGAFSGTYAEAEARPQESWVQQLEMPTFVAVRDGDDVGMVRCARDARDEGTAWLMSMWVAPEARRSGIGSALVDAIIEYARSRRLTRLVLDVADDNAAAIALYARKGFEPTVLTGTMPPPRQHIREHRRSLTLASR